VRQVNITTFGHIKNFLSGLCRHAAKKGMMDFSIGKKNSGNPVRPALASEWMKRESTPFCPIKRKRSVPRERESCVALGWRLRVDE
jgi:hypothetical protein